MHTNGFAKLIIICLLPFLFSLTGCGGGGGSGASDQPTGPTLSLGSPSADPTLVPPSTTDTQVKFLAVVNGSALPPEVLSLDEVDANGNVVMPNVAQLRDDGEAADVTLGDRVYTGTVTIPGATPLASLEKNYRVSTQFNGATLTSPATNFWVSGCPATSRPSDPAQAVLDAVNHRTIFANELMIRTAAGVAPDLDKINALLTGINGHIVGCIPALRQYLVEFANTDPNGKVAGVNSAIDNVLMQPGIIAAFPNVQSLLQADTPLAISLLCNGNVDTNCQWYLDRMRARQAWQLAGGGDPQRGVAVIDFGVDCNVGGLPCDPTLYNSDPIDHGTGVAGVIGAPSSTTGMVGVAYDTQLYPHSFLSGSGSQYKMNELITSSLSQPGVRVINISAGTGADLDGQIKSALCTAIGSGRLVVAAAGNPTGADANSCALTNVYPAAYHDGTSLCSNGADLQKGLLVVGATDINNNLAHWQSGAQPVCSNTKYAELYAPGKDIVTLSTQFGYTLKSGTSYAAPLVSGAAAVLWTVHPDYSPAQIHDQLLSSATRVSSTDPLLAGKAIPVIDLYRAVGGVDTIPTPNTVPNPYTIPDSTDAPLQTRVPSTPVVITGMDSPTPIAISGGDYNINDGPYTSAAGSIHSGDRVRVRLRTANMENVTSMADLRIGKVHQPYHVTTHSPHTTPQADDFPPQRDVTPDSDVFSNSRSYSAITPSTIHIDNGDYTLDGGTTFTHVDGMINPNQTVQMRVHSPKGFASTARATLKIGNTSLPFSVTTPNGDTTPDAFSLTISSTPLTGLAPNTQLITDAIPISGINAPTTISISGSGGQYSIGGEVYTDATGVVNAGDLVYVRLTTGANIGDVVSTTLTIGGISRLLTLTTGQYNVTGLITGVAGITASGLSLQNTSATNVVTPIELTPISGSEVASLGFALPVIDGNSYNISVVTQPAGQTCTVTNGGGAINAANVSNVVVGCNPITVSANIWTWMGGSNLLNQSGSYGTKGVAALTNMPGARQHAVSWTDKQGNFWLFGGFGYDSGGAQGDLNDLWKYDGTNWIWVSGSNIINQAGNYGTQGVVASTNIPGARRNVINWIDLQGNLWLFGGSNSANGYMNDLWKFDGTNWTWISGSNVDNQSGNYGIKGIAGMNVPGARTSSTSWTDTQGNFWLFGGEGYDSSGFNGGLNDLWKFDGTNMTWTWVSGFNIAEVNGTYGTLGVASAKNAPGARIGAVGWIDSSNNLWLFGGYGYDNSGGGYFYLNDLWKFDGTNWTWVSGSDVSSQYGNYGTIGVTATTNMPGARYLATGWIDASNNLWLFGGSGVDGGGDLWKFDGTNWTWVSGSNIGNQLPNYGTLGVAATTNMPGGGVAAVSWKDNQGNFWLFGSDHGFSGYRNDLWRYQP